MDAGANDLLDRMVPAVALVTILAFGSDIGDFVLRLVGCVARLPSPPITPQRAPFRNRPDGSGDQLQQLSLAGAVGAHEHPVLAGANVPIDGAQHRAIAAL